MVHYGVYPEIQVRSVLQRLDEDGYGASVEYYEEGKTEVVGKNN
jgi:hypothetical protein